VALTEGGCIEGRAEVQEVVVGGRHGEAQEGVAGEWHGKTLGE